FFRYSRSAALDLLGRAVSARWPAERVIQLAECSGAASARYRPPELSDRSSSFPGVGQPSDDGYVAVTGSRLVFLERLTHASMLSGLAAALLAVGLVVLFAGQQILPFVALAAAASGMWMLATVIEMSQLGKSALAFDRVLVTDPIAGRIEGMNGCG